MKESLSAETITITGHGGDEIEAYVARPGDAETFGGVVVIHHMPGYDASTKEIARKFAAHGYLAIMPNLYWRDAPGASPDDAAAAARAKGWHYRQRTVTVTRTASAGEGGVPFNGDVYVLTVTA